jgi:Cysteine-rich secretory protein family
VASLTAPNLFPLRNMAAFMTRDLLLSLLRLFLLCSPLVSAHNHLWHRDVETVTIYAPAPSSAPSASYTTESVLVDSILNSTNIFRDQHNATPLMWNSSLADAASSWASNCQFEHSGGPTGENLAIGYPDMASAIDAWGNERDLYDFNGPTGFSEETGHFTQLVWKATTSLGCAASDCSGKNSLKGFLVVCEYSPSGNVVGQGNAHFRANVQAQVRAEAPQASISTSQLSTSMQVPITLTIAQNAAATVVQVATSVNFVTARARSTAFGLGDEAAADQLESKSRGRWAIGVTLAAIVIAGAVG